MGNGGFATEPLLPQNSQQARDDKPLASVRSFH